jgi:plasmid stability protein
MATLTIRDLSEDVVKRIKEAAAIDGVSMEQAVRDVLEARFAPRSRVLERVRERWARLPKVTAKNVQEWRVRGRR